MFKTLFEPGAVMVLPVISMLFFVAVFLFVLARVITCGRSHYERAAAMPLDTAPVADRQRESERRLS